MPFVALERKLGAKFQSLTLAFAAGVLRGTRSDVAGRNVWRCLRFCTVDKFLLEVFCEMALEKSAREGSDVLLCDGVFQAVDFAEDFADDFAEDWKEKRCGEIFFTVEQLPLVLFENWERWLPISFLRSWDFLPALALLLEDDRENLLANENLADAGVWSFIPFKADDVRE
mmetsp:Transcript_44528/g.93428  ORF Transcript_44528/g.93428 Transcript_44528/m.93428 type:complete len:171 (+) Transcript_44528:1004-1516(+)